MTVRETEATPTELQTIELTEVLVPLDRPAAERLDSRIRLIAGQFIADWAKLCTLVEQAKAGQIHVTLGYPSWTAYVADVSGQMKVTPEIRPEAVELLASAGMSTRAIAAVTGVSKTTVVRDLSGGPNGPPEGDGAAGERPPITGLDGKTYPNKPIRREPPRRKPFPGEFGGSVHDLFRPVEKVQKFAGDDRFRT